MGIYLKVANSKKDYDESNYEDLGRTGWSTLIDGRGALVTSGDIGEMMNELCAQGSDWIYTDDAHVLFLIGEYMYRHMVTEAWVVFE